MKPITKTDEAIIVASERIKGQPLDAALYDLISENERLKLQVTELRKQLFQNQTSHKVTPELVEAIKKRVLT